MQLCKCVFEREEQSTKECSTWDVKQVGLVSIEQFRLAIVQANGRRVMHWD